MGAESKSEKIRGHPGCWLEASAPKSVCWSDGGSELWGVGKSLPAWWCLEAGEKDGLETGVVEAGKDGSGEAKLTCGMQDPSVIPTRRVLQATHCIIISLLENGRPLH